MEKTKTSAAVGTVALIIILSVVYALVIEQVLSNDVFENIDVSATITNETLSAVDNITNSTFAIKSTYSGASCSLTIVNNATGGEEIVGTGNYTYYSPECNIILQDGSPYIGEDVNVTYVYTYESNSTLSGVNVTTLKTDFGLFITAILSFIAIGGTLLGILWFLRYAKPLLSKEEGIKGMSA